jgi:hypothetical protein
MTIALVFARLKDDTLICRVLKESYFKYGMLGIIAMVMFADAGYAHPGLVTVIVVFLTSFCIATSIKKIKNKTFSIFENILIFLGKYSYSIYLWHYPILIYFTVHTYPSTVTDFSKLCLLASVLILSITSQRLVEEPIVKLENKKMIFAFCFFVFSSLTIVGFLAVASLPHYFKSYKNFAYGQSAVNAINLVEQSSAKDSLIRQEVKNDIENECIFRFSSWSRANIAQIEYCYKKHGRGIAVFGDSHAHDLYLWLALQQKNNFLVSFSRPGCRLEPKPMAGCIDNERLDELDGFLNNFRKGYFEESGLYMFLANGKPADRNVISSSRSFDHDFSYLSANTDLLVYKTKILERLALHIPLTVIGPRYEPHLDFSYYEKVGCEAELPTRRVLMQKYSELGERFKRLMVDDKGKNIIFLSPEPMLDPKKRIYFGDCQKLLWRDGDHYSYQGMSFFYGNLLHFD